VTHRGTASAFLVVSAHDEDAFASAVSGVQPNALTIVVLMGLGRSTAVAGRLIERGWSRGTPAAIVVDGTREQQQVWRGSLADLASDCVDVRGGGAGTIVVGEVAALDLQPAVDAQEIPADRKRPAIGGHHVSRG
jgi:siroheme synthase